MPHFVNTFVTDVVFVLAIIINALVKCHCGVKGFGSRNLMATLFKFMSVKDTTDQTCLLLDFMFCCTQLSQAVFVCRIHEIGYTTRRGKGLYVDTMIVKFVTRFMLFNNSSHRLAYSQRYETQQVSNYHAKACLIIQADLLW